MKTLITDPFPVLKTQRLTLRRLTPEDAEPMFRLRSNRDVMRLIDRPLCATLDDADKLVASILEMQSNGEAIMWAMSLHDDPVMIGCIGCFRTQAEHSRTEVGYLLNPDSQRRGLMSEAINAVVDYGFEEIGFHKITASVNALNTASIGLLEKNGFTREAFFRQHYFWNGNFIDTMELARYSPAAELAMKERESNPILDVHE